MTNCCSGNEPIVDFRSLEEFYRRQQGTPGALNEHMDTLRDLAAQCEHVTDVGITSEFATPALLAGRPAKMVTYLNDGIIDRLMNDDIRGETWLQPKPFQDRTRKEIEETDLLFMEPEAFTGLQFLSDLRRWAPRVRRWIAAAHVIAYGETGERGRPGMFHGLRQFLQEQPQWFVWQVKAEQKGLVVLSRRPDDRPKLPSVPRMAWNYAKAVAGHLASGRQVVSDAVRESRLAACSVCPARVDDRCSLCGCFLSDPVEGKAAWPEQNCQIGNWPV